MNYRYKVEESAITVEVQNAIAQAVDRANHARIVVGLFTLEGRRYRVVERAGTAYRR